MSWKEILKAGCMAKAGECDCSECIMEKAGDKPDYIDLDGDGDKKESMKQAAKDKKRRSAFTSKD